MLKVIETAMAEIGVKEEHHEVKYASDIFPNEKLKPWCVTFIDWIFQQAYGREKALEMLCLTEYTQSVNTIVGAFREHGKWHREYLAEGWLMFLRSREHRRIDHVELVISVADDTITTISGNCDKEVKTNTHKIADKVIAGYGEITYDEGENINLVRVRDYAYI